jgi:RES domain-containing protein
MRLWRLFNPKYSSLAADGSAKYGGRWNPIGCAVLYLGENLSIVAWERYVHIEAKPPKDLRLSAMSIDLTPELVGKIAHLPNLDLDWQDRQDYTQNIGLQWVNSRESPILRVPSAVIPYQYNYLINPHHPLGDRFLKDLSPGIFEFKYDSRSW